MGTDRSATLARTDPYTTSFEARVESVDGRAVRLEETYFYPEGGGQPADRGTLAGVPLEDVRKRGGEAVHVLEKTPPFSAGDTVEGSVDEQFRTYCMRAHTASHVVYGAGRTLFDTHGYGGFDIDERRVRLDFEVEANARDVDKLALQRAANEAVWEGLSVEWYGMDAAAARNDGEIVFNLGDDTEASDTVRIVEIDGWDIAACGGTHVRNTAEIGPIKLLDVSNPGSGLVRVEYAVGPTAIERQITETESATRAATVLDTGIEGLPQRAEALLEERRSLEAELETLRDRLLEARMETLAGDTLREGDEEWLVGTVEGIDATAAAEYLRSTDLPTDVVVLTGTDGSTFVVVGTDGGADAGDIVGRITDEFGGGGGGSPSLAQGGGLTADPDAVAEHVRDDWTGT